MTIPEMEGGKIEKKIKARVIHKKKDNNKAKRNIGIIRIRVENNNKKNIQRIIKMNNKKKYG